MSKDCNEIQKKFNYLDGLRLTKLEEIKKIEIQIKVLEELFPDAFTLQVPVNETVTKDCAKDCTNIHKNIQKNNSRQKSSKYKGVRIAHGRAQAQWYDKTKKKVVYVGSFDTEEEAYQAYLNYAEQRENNPDRTVSKRSYKKNRPPESINEDELHQIDRWECMKCKRKYKTSQMPVRCVPECGSISFNMIS